MLYRIPVCLDWYAGEDYVNVSMGWMVAMDSPDGTAVKGSLATLHFKILDAAWVAGTVQAHVASAQLKGQYGDSFDWYTVLNTYDGEVQVSSVIHDLETIRQTLFVQFTIIDADQDGLLSLEEARHAVPVMTGEDFALLDANNDELLSLEEVTPPEGGCGCPFDAGKKLDWRRCLGDLLTLGLALWSCSPQGAFMRG